MYLDDYSIDSWATLYEGPLDQSDTANEKGWLGIDEWLRVMYNPTAKLKIKVCKKDYYRRG